MSIIALMVVLMIVNFWYGSKTLERLYMVMAMSSNMFMLFFVFGAQMEARYWRWRAKRGWRFDDPPKDPLTEPGNHMIVGVRWDALKPDVLFWCRENCKSSYGVMPWISEYDIGKKSVIWFANGDDAFHFKMRWL